MNEMVAKMCTLREEAARELAKRASENPTDEEIKVAAQLMEKFYQICSFEKDLEILQNDEEKCNYYCTKLVEEAAGWLWETLDFILETRYKAKLRFFCNTPCICDLETGSDLELRHFAD